MSHHFLCILITPHRLDASKNITISPLKWIFWAEQNKKTRIVVII